MTDAPRARLDFAPARVVREDIGGGAFILRSPQPLKPYERSVCHWLLKWAEQTPDAVFLADRDPATGEWRKLTYAETLARVRSLAQGLLDRELSPERPLMLLSDNSIENALLQLAAMYVGVPSVPVSPAYSLMSQDFAKLRHIHELIAPGLVFADDGAKFASALNVLDLSAALVTIARNPPGTIPVTAFDELAETTPGQGVDAALERTGPDTVAKILFTSGSTGTPKGVINTHRMLCSNQQAIAQLWRFLRDKPPVTIDWLPWHHTFGGNHNFNMILRNGGTLYVDGGKPAPGLVEKTIANLRDVAPTIYFNVPRGFDMIIPQMEADPALRDRFFSRLDTVFYAAAALPQHLWQRLEALSLAARGERIVMTSAWGATETAPLVTSVHFPIDRAGVIGLPAPGSELKMVPNAGKLEMRVRGPNVTPGYFRNDEMTRAAFDENGFYRIGDAGKLADPDDPARGIIFDGRVAEDFKLTTGTWVNVGKVRIEAIAACAPLVQDAVVTGHDRDEIGLLIFPNPAGCAQVSGLPASSPLAELIADETVRAHLKEALTAYNGDHPASSQRIARALFLDRPPSIDANEITDKGYINQRAVLECRAAEVERLYSQDPQIIRV